MGAKGKIVQVTMDHPTLGKRVFEVKPENITDNIKDRQLGASHKQAENYIKDVLANFQDASFKKVTIVKGQSVGASCINSEAPTDFIKDYEKYSEQSIYSSFGVPPDMIGRNQDGKMGTVREEERERYQRLIGLERASRKPIEAMKLEANALTDLKIKSVKAFASSGNLSDSLRKLPTLKDLKSGQKFKFERYGSLCIFSYFSEGKCFYRNLKKKENIETDEIDQLVILQ